MCWFATYKNKDVVLKEGRKTMNYNRDYMIVDKLKPLFGLNEIKMTRIIINKISRKVDKNIKSWYNNSEWIDKPNSVYTIMKKINGNMLSKEKDKIKGDVLLQLLKIGLYRGIFRVTDFNLRNIFITPTNQLYSIDEHNINKRDKIFPHKHMIAFFKTHVTKTQLDSILDELYSNQELKIKAIVKEMKKYNFEDAIIQKVLKNFKNLKKDAYSELAFK